MDSIAERNVLSDALWELCRTRQNGTAVDRLIKQGADPNWIAKGFTPLHGMCYCTDWPDGIGRLWGRRQRHQQRNSPLLSHASDRNGQSPAPCLDARRDMPAVSRGP